MPGLAPHTLGDCEEGQRQTVGANTKTSSDKEAMKHQEGITAAQTNEDSLNSSVETAQHANYPNGYHFPPKHSFGYTAKVWSMWLWNYITTIKGFVISIYWLNVVAWGGMIFLLLCRAAPAMCNPDCDADDSAYKKWIEIDAQVLNALFCVTGFGLAPWRVRDLWYLMKYRLQDDRMALRRLAAIHSGWFRMPGSTHLAPEYGPTSVTEELAVEITHNMPHPASKMAESPLTGVRAPDTPLWKLDLVVWLWIWNTLFQCALAGCMWGMNRFQRPDWTTALFIVLSFGCAIIAGVVMGTEGSKVKSYEGVPLSDEDVARLAADREKGIYHFNNHKDEDLNAKRAKKQAKKDAKRAKKEAKKEKSTDSVV